MEKPSKKEKAKKVETAEEGFIGSAIITLKKAGFLLQKEEFLGNTEVPRPYLICNDHDSYQLKAIVGGMWTTVYRKLRGNAEIDEMDSTKTRDNHEILALVEKLSI